MDFITSSEDWPERLKPQEETVLFYEVVGSTTTSTRRLYLSTSPIRGTNFQGIKLEELPHSLPSVWSTRVDGEVKVENPRSRDTERSTAYETSVSRISKNIRRKDLFVVYVSPRKHLITCWLLCLFPKSLISPKFIRLP